MNEFKSVKFPTGGTVFDYYIDSETKQFVSWSESLGRFELDPDMPLQVIIYLNNLCICEKIFEITKCSSAASTNRDP